MKLSKILIVILITFLSACDRKHQADQQVNQIIIPEELRPIVEMDLPLAEAKDDAVARQIGLQGCRNNCSVEHEGSMLNVCLDFCDCLYRLPNGNATLTVSYAKVATCLNTLVLNASK